ncbi:MAG: outer membrane protein assembly factor BamC [Curvibacter sp.]
MKSASKLVLLGLTLALAACTVLETDKVDYKGAAKAPPLAIPPDLTQLPRDTRYTMPGATVSATGYQNASQAPGNTVASAFPGLRLEGQGAQRWLVVDQPPEKLWPELKAFWQQIGLPLVMEDPQLGIMETDWAQNRAKLPQDFIRRTLGGVLDILFSTGMLDKYRTRLERHAGGGTEIYISHRGLEEVVRPDTPTKTTWQPRPTDTEMEVEMLRRLMLKLGASPQQAGQQVATVAPRPTARVEQREGRPVVLVNEGFDRAWRRVGLTLDRTGFTVEDRDRSQGLYYVRYVEPRAPGEEEPGFFSRLFSGTPRDKTPQKYRITVRAEGETSTVAVLNADGAPESSDAAQRILKVIADDLR